jgi:hypothetical protein
MTLQAERLKVAAPMLPKNNPWLRYFGWLWRLRHRLEVESSLDFTH